MPADDGLPGSARRLGRTVLEITEVRLALLGTEVEREKLRLARGLLFAAAGVACGIVALLSLLAATFLMVDPSLRFAMIATLGAVGALLAAGLVRAARHALRAPAGGVFALSRSELRRDVEALRSPPP